MLLQKQKLGIFEDQDLIIIRGKKVSALINDWENDVAYGKSSSKARPWLLSVICLILYAVHK